MSFSKSTLCIALLLASCAHAGEKDLTQEEINFVLESGALESDLSNEALKGTVPKQVKQRLDRNDRETLQVLKSAGEKPQERITAADESLMDELVEAADKPVTSWMDTLAGSPFVTPQMREMAKGETTQPDNKLSEDVRLLVFISLGMPEATLKSLLKQAEGSPEIVFVLRGWKPPHFQAVVRRVAQLQPEGEEAASVIIDPNLFRQYGVNQVPMYLGMDKKGSWRRLYGEIGLEGAIEELLAGRHDQLIGPTYAVTEPDILSEIENRIAGHDWDAELEGAKERAKSFRPGFDLPTSEKDETYFVDPSITINQDILNPQTGEMVAAAGTQINPLDTIVMDKAYVVFDPEVRGQVDMVKAHLKEHPFSMLIATRLPEYVEGQPGLAEVLNTQIFTLNQQMVERFALKASPSIIEQEGTMLKVTVMRGSL